MFYEEQRIHALHPCEEGYSVEGVALNIGWSTYSSIRWRRALAMKSPVWQNPDMRNTHTDAALRNEDLVRAVTLLVASEPVSLLRDQVVLSVTLRTPYRDVDNRYGISTIVYRVLQHLGYTCKLVERLMLEHSVREQSEFSVMINKLPLRCLVSVDGTHTDDGDVYRKFGRNLRADPLELIDRDSRTLLMTCTMIVSMTQGVFWSQTVVLGPAQTADDWRLFL